MCATFHSNRKSFLARRKKNREELGKRRKHTGEDAERRVEDVRDSWKCQSWPAFLLQRLIESCYHIYVVLVDAFSFYFISHVCDKTTAIAYL